MKRLARLCMVVQELPGEARGIIVRGCDDGIQQPCLRFVVIPGGKLDEEVEQSSERVYRDISSPMDPFGYPHQHPKTGADELVFGHQAVEQIRHRERVDKAPLPSGRFWDLGSALGAEEEAFRTERPLLCDAPVRGLWRRSQRSAQWLAPKECPEDQGIAVLPRVLHFCAG